MSSYNQKGLINVEYESGFIDMVQTYSFLLDELNRSNWTQYLENSVFQVADRRFNAYMLANKEKYKHMFEWGAATANVGDRLWQTVNLNGYVLFDFVESKKKVPVSLPFTKYRHVFREKAELFEQGASVAVEPVQSKYLRWRGGSAGGDHGGKAVVLPDGTTEIRHPGPIYVEELGGGKYKNSFENAFLMHWASGGGGTIQEFTKEIANDPAYEFQVKKHKIAGLKRSRTMLKKKAQRGSNRSRQLAKERRLEIEKELMQLGVKL